MRAFIDIIVEGQTDGQSLPPVLVKLAKAIASKSWDATKRLIVSKVGSVGPREKIDDDVADSVFLRIQRNAQVGRYDDEAELRNYRRDAKRLTGDQPVEIFRAAPRQTAIRAGDFCTTSKEEAGYYLHGGHVMYRKVVPAHDLIAVEGTLGGGQELVYLPRDYQKIEPVVFYRTLRDFWEASGEL